ncbi:hypothetical protein R3P38DRAFT_2786851 [Favolaschia claudopus]|uniref:Uncharacterized protein n=1 Tax=Favolaschia claudopus TaxID=2862362 RepID=A0AAW0APQ0_9AGAR
MGADFGTLMLSFLTALFLFSNASSRKRPFFFFSAAAVTLGALEGFMIAHFHASYSSAQAVLNPLKITNAYTAVVNFVLLFAPIPVQMILLLRIVSAYQERWLILVLLLPVVIFIARIFNMLVAIIQIATRPWNFVTDWNHLPFSKIEWILQLIFNVYVSLAFLRQLDLPQRKKRHSLQVWNTLRMIWMTSLTNFIIPCILHVVQTALILHGGHGKTEDQWLSECSLMMVLNGYLTIIGVVFATVWANWTIHEAEVWSRVPTTPSSAASQWSQDSHASEL